MNVSGVEKHGLDGQLHCKTFIRDFLINFHKYVLLEFHRENLVTSKVKKGLACSHESSRCESPTTKKMEENVPEK